MATTIPKTKPRGSRKKQPEENSMEFFEVPSGFEFSKPPASQRSHAPPPPLAAAPVSVMARQPTANEAALSAKNYRLAKELSDLRVRYREECQKTARMTIENMSLASRCREAISHVAMLQRELDIYQTRDAEALALQRKQTQRFASSLSDRQQFDANGRDALPVPPKKSVSPMPPIKNQGIEKTISASTPPESRLSSSTGTSAMEMASDDDTFEKSRDESYQSSFVSPTSSPDTSNNDSSYIFTPSPNSHYSSPKKRDTPLHISPTRGDLNSPKQQRLIQSTTSPLQIPVSPSRKHRRSSSRDLFEASFSSTFPSNFHSTPGEEAEEEESQSSTKADVYDPFSAFARPNSMAAVVRHAQVDAASELEEQLPKPTNLYSSEKPNITPMVSWEDEEVSSSSSFSTPPRRRPGDEESDENEPPKTPAKTPSVEARAKYENAMGPAIRQQTPPRRRPGDESDIENEPPETPVKTPSAEARSKYDFALKPRENTPSSIESVVQAKHVRPSPLLKRIQQKRKQKKLNRQQSEPSSTVPKPDFRRYSSAPESRTVAEGTPSIISENRDGSIVSLEEETAPAIASRSRRRSVKQPVSYAEPALNTKIRKGHVFFHKDDDDDYDDNDDVVQQ